MIEISRTGIRNLASDEVTYSRGLQYYKNNQVVSASYSSQKKRYLFTVKGNYNYTVVVEESKDGGVNYHCNCPSSLKENGACKHVVASLLYLLKYQEQETASESKNPEEQKIRKIIDYFSVQEDNLSVGETFHLGAVINIPSILKKDQNYSYLSVVAGGERSYKVQSLKKFLSDLYSGENILLGKQFKYINGESRFDKSSKEFVDYMLEVYELHNMMSENVRTAKLYNKSQMLMTKNMLFKVLSMFTETPFTLELYSKTYENVTFQVGNPKLEYEISMNDDAIFMDYQKEEMSPVIPIMSSGELLYHNGVVYLPDKKFIRNYVPFFRLLGKDKEPLVFEGESKKQFLEYVLPKISDTMNLDIPDELKQFYLTYDLQIEVYLDRYQNGLKAEVRYIYGDVNFNSFQNAVKDSFIIVRQREKEDDFIGKLLSLDFVPYQNFYILKDDEKIYEFIQDGVAELEPNCTMFYSESFKKLRIKGPGKAHAGLRMNSGLDMLEFDLSYDDIPKEEITSMFQAYRLKKKFFRLKDGSFINLNDDSMNEMADVLKLLKLDKVKEETESFLLPKQNALYLDKLFSDKKIAYDKDQNVSEFINKIQNPMIYEHKMPDRIYATLRGYQESGVKWLLTLSELRLGGILADDMGLGKTLQSIVYIAYQLQNIEESKQKPFLIVCPTSLTYNWMDEFEEFAPWIRCRVIDGNPKIRQELIESYQQVHVLITSYPLLRRDLEIYEKIEFDTMFIDEAQFIKNSSSLSAKAVKRMKADHYFALTGTPIENSLSELWSIFDFILPDFLFSHNKFVELYEKPIMHGDENAVHDLERHIAPFILRRMKKDVLKELPDKYETKLLTELTEEQKKVYAAYIDSIRNEMNEAIRENGVEKNKMRILAVLTRLRQICCHPATFIDNYEGGSGKLDLLLEVLHDALANEHRVLIFSQFTSMFEIIMKELKARNIEYFYIEGSTKNIDRQNYVKRFNDGERQVFLISLKAGGTGLNLVGADTVIHYDPWWNPAVEEQATDRAYRIGQVNKVHVMKLITKGTIEEKIYKLQQKKRHLSDSVIHSKEVFLNTLSNEELMELFMV